MFRDGSVVVLATLSIVAGTISATFDPSARDSNGCPMRRCAPESHGCDSCRRSRSARAAGPGERLTLVSEVTGIAAFPTWLPRLTLMKHARCRRGSRRPALPKVGCPMQLDEVRFLTVAEVAALMRVSKMTVYRLVHSGELTAVRVGRSFRVPEHAVHDYLRGAFSQTA